MLSHEIISQQTDKALREAAIKYKQKIAVPCYLDGVNGFAKTYLKNAGGSLETLVTTWEDTLTVSSRDEQDRTQVFVNMDLNVEGPISIVRPGFYNKNGEPDPTNGKWTRPIVRPLTEIEGRELTMDLYSIMKKIPQDRLRK